MSNHNYVTWSHRNFRDPVIMMSNHQLMIALSGIAINHRNPMERPGWIATAQGDYRFQAERVWRRRTLDLYLNETSWRTIRTNSWVVQRITKLPTITEDMRQSSTVRTRGISRVHWSSAVAHLSARRLDREQRWVGWSYCRCFVNCATGFEIESLLNG